MPVTFKIDNEMRQFTDGVGTVPVAGGTVASALGDLAAQYPKLQSRLYNAAGALNPFVMVLVNDEDVRTFDAEWDTPVADADVLELLPPTSGG